MTRWLNSEELRFTEASAGRILTPRRCSSSWNAADRFANCTVRRVERFRKSQVTEVAWIKDQTLRASARADSSNESACTFRGIREQIRKNPTRWQRTARPRGRGGDRFCLADTGLPDDDITLEIREMRHCGRDVLYPFVHFSIFVRQAGQRLLEKAGSSRNFLRGRPSI